MDTIQWFTILKVLISIIIIACVIWMLHSPSILKPLISYWVPQIKYIPSKYATITNDYTLYSRKDVMPATRLLVWFQGGSFVYCNLSSSYGLLNNLYDKLQNFDILCINYPVRFEHTVHDAMLSINQTLSKFLTYHEYHAAGISAGVLLQGTFIKKERSMNVANIIKVPQIGIHFTSFIGINGVYNTHFSSPLLTYLFEYYIMRNTPGIEAYDCEHIMIPRLIITSKQDFLHQQTENFIANEPSTVKVYNNDRLTHASPLFQNIPESLDIVQTISTWLMESKFRY